MAFTKYFKTIAFIAVISCNGVSTYAQVDSVKLAEEYYNTGIGVFDYTQEAGR